MKKFKFNLHNPWFLRSILLILICLTIFINLPHLYAEIYRIYKFRQLTSYNVIGYKFFGLEEFLWNEKYVGYYTNEDIKEKRPQKLLTHAQLVLAPTIVEHGNLNHKYIIFVCSSPQEALRKIHEIDAQPLIQNQYNVILAKRKDK